MLRHLRDAAEERRALDHEEAGTGVTDPEWPHGGSYADRLRTSIESSRRAVSDQQVLAAWQMTTGEAGDPDADLLIAEIERRNLDL
ncbi:hypothetical protein [Sphingomonas guangdongensis]|uniref:hypothetical protein n=1 Tax=Sphingomonas guangdongensis TaxID=1141890 RepID=UPI0015C78B7C|nr:hypothetical protein [Sphingomonas guangdongensis]